MLLTLLLITILISFAFTLFLEKLFLKYSIFIDEPNARSSHKKPVPTSGGLAILFSYLIFIYLIDANIGGDLNPPGAGVWELPGMGINKPAVGERYVPE